MKDSQLYEHVGIVAREVYGYTFRGAPESTQPKSIQCTDQERKCPMDHGSCSRPAIIPREPTFCQCWVCRKGTLPCRLTSYTRALNTWGCRSETT
jgi:hypothetical protein